MLAERFFSANIDWYSGRLLQDWNVDEAANSESGGGLCSGLLIGTEISKEFNDHICRLRAALQSPPMVGGHVGGGGGGGGGRDRDVVATACEEKRMDDNRLTVSEKLIVAEQNLDVTKTLSRLSASLWTFEKATSADIDPTPTVLLKNVFSFDRAVKYFLQLIILHPSKQSDALREQVRVLLRSLAGESNTGITAGIDYRFPISRHFGYDDSVSRLSLHP